MTKRPSKKLDYKRLGPFRIIMKVNELAYGLKLSPSFKIQPVISPSRLEPDIWQKLCPRVTLKIRYPVTRDIIDSVENGRILVQDFERRFDQDTFRRCSTVGGLLEGWCDETFCRCDVHVTFFVSR